MMTAVSAKYDSAQETDNETVASAEAEQGPLSQMDAPLVRFFPVFGSTWAQAVHYLMLLGIAIYFTCYEIDGKAAPLGAHLPKAGLRSEIAAARWLLIFGVVLSAIRLPLARCMLRSEACQQVWQHSQGSCLCPETYDVRVKRERLLLKLQVYIRRIVIACFCLPFASALALLLLFARTELWPFYLTLIVPWSATLWSSACMTGSLWVVAAWCAHAVDRLSADLEYSKEVGSFSSGYWIQKMKEYLVLQQIIANVSGPMFWLLLSCLLYNVGAASVFIFAATSAVSSHALQQDRSASISDAGAVATVAPALPSVPAPVPHVEGDAGVLTAVLCCLSLLGVCGAIWTTLYPLARVNSRPNSASQKEPSLLASAISCGQVEMPGNVSLDYMKFIQVLQMSPVSLAAPVVGIVSAQDLARFGGTFSISVMLATVGLLAMVVSE